MIVQPRMIFPTTDFALFFLIVFSLNWLLRSRRGVWKVFMLVASYFFYGYWDWRFVPLLVASSAVNHLAALGLHRFAQPNRRKAILASAVFLNLGSIAFFKYSRFFVEQAVWITHLTGSDVTAWFPMLEYVSRIILPVGISFFTFQALSYVVDVYRGHMPPAERFIDFALYLAFFPQLVAGPIVRASDLVPQISHPVSPRVLDTGRAACLILGGLFKKIVVANTLAESIVDPVFSRPDLFGAADTLFAVYGYAIQIYCDFSAYSDIAIGLCLLLGFRIPINFDAPYLADSIQAFWRRWHISLSSFLRDYLYIPLGGSRASEPRILANLFITFLLGGLWHGAGWTFIAWGALHGLYLSLERIFGRLGSAAGAKKSPPGPILSVFRRLAVWHLVCLSWLFFRGQNFSEALEMLSALGRWSQPATRLNAGIVAVVFIGYMTQFLDGQRIEKAWDAFGRLPVWAQGVLAAAVLTVILGLGPTGVAPFIYFQF
ncbi:MAG: MBOAT family protein [Kiritimatiellia bacterium]|nr:MBOAT family protein [Kiritimatiellia bacterium]